MNVWIAYTEDHTIWGTGETQDEAVLDAVRHSEGIDQVVTEGVATAPATRAVVALVDTLGGDPTDWAAMGIVWSLVSGVATIVDQG